MPSFSNKEFITSRLTPAVGVLVELNGLAQGWIFLGLVEQPALLCAAVAIVLADGLDDGARVNALVDVQRDGRYLKGGVLRLARPLQLRVQVRIIGVGFLRPRVRIGVGRH
jgi:hypothetical protein